MAILSPGKANSPTAVRRRKVAGAQEGDGGTGTVPRRIKLLPLIKELKILTKDLRVVRLGDTINYAQLEVVRESERQLAAKGQIRICTLKARQIGVSTIIEAICFVLSMMFNDFNSLIVSHEDKSAGYILGMTRRYWDTFVFAKYYDERYNGQKHLAWNNKSDIDIATAKNVGAGRSRTIQFLHASEVAFWPDPDTLMTGLGNSIPSFGLSCVFLESTANGVGNYFHKQCNSAMKGESEYKFLFFPWHEHPEYTAQFLPPEEIDKYKLDNLDEEEQRLRHRHGVSDARLIWRRWAIRNRCGGDVEKFHQEFPTTPHEAFISTGRNVFPLMQLLDHYDPLVPKRGRLIKISGRIRFIEDPGGWLSVFAEPSDDQDWGIYLCGGDPTHTTVGDYACIQVLNRRTLEQVAVYRRKIDPINFGKDMQLIGSWYNTATLVPEATGPGYATIGCLIADNYPLVYQRQHVEKMQGHTSNDVYGWVTGQQTKELAIAHLLKAVMDVLVTIGNSTYGLVIHDEVTLMEMRDYVTTEKGLGYENSDGSEYDDGVMALALAVVGNNLEPPPPAYEMLEEHLMPKRYKQPATQMLTAGTARPIDNLPADTHVPQPEPERFEDEAEEAPWEAWGRPRETVE